MSTSTGQISGGWTYNRNGPLVIPQMHPDDGDKASLWNIGS
jgi:hypothetical protein